MKKNLLTSLIILCLFTAVRTSYSVPLNGEYTIGTGGDYTSISQAITDVTARGVSGHTTFRIFSGIYTEPIHVGKIPGSGSLASVSFESFAQDPDSVSIAANPAAVLDSASYFLLKYLTFKGDVDLKGGCSEVIIFVNKFSDKQITQTIGNISQINITGNTDMRGILLDASANDNILIQENVCLSPFGFIEVTYANTITINKNITNTLIVDYCVNVKLDGNKITMFNESDSGFDINFCDTVRVYNNFTMDEADSSLVFFRGNKLLDIQSNTFRSESPFNSTTVEINDNEATGFRNNIVTNMDGMYVMDIHSNVDYSSDYNIYYNTATPTQFIRYNGIDYSELSSFTSATGLDSLSVRKEVTFTGPRDLHLAAPSIGDEDLIGNPHVMVTHDIDGEVRHSLYPYRGADEADMPLPVELASFTYSTSNNNITLLWSTVSELNNT